MKFKKSEERVYYSVLPDEKRRYDAIVRSWDNEHIMLELLERPSELNVDETVVIVVQDTNGWNKYYTRIKEVKENNMKLELISTERRRYFRIDDVIPIIIKRVDKETPCRSRVFMSSAVILPEEPPDSSINPRLWQILLEINTKLSMILEKLQIEDEELINAPPVKVNLSAVGARFQTSEQVSVGDTVEVKMLLPTCPTTGLLLYGEVVRINELEEGKYEVAIDFSETEETVREIILRYAFDKQREILRKRKEVEEKI
jgi:uncharacterized protein YbaR (Trm112 family)